MESNEVKWFVYATHLNHRHWVNLYYHPPEEKYVIRLDLFLVQIIIAIIGAILVGSASILLNILKLPYLIFKTAYDMSHQFNTCFGFADRRPICQDVCSNLVACQHPPTLTWNDISSLILLIIYILILAPIAIIIITCLSPAIILLLPFGIGLKSSFQTVPIIGIKYTILSWYLQIRDYDLFINEFAGKKKTILPDIFRVAYHKNNQYQIIQNHTPNYVSEDAIYVSV